jgi:hypothetical protein
MEKPSNGSEVIVRQLTDYDRVFGLVGQTEDGVTG